jgi:hypothetical protein
VAGESARDVARRQREKAARLERSAAMWERGAEGEATTAAALVELERHGWTTFHDVRWPGRPRANIDHVVVGPSGVFVIDSKNWSGNIRLVGDVLYQGSHRREREVAAAADAAIAVSQVLQGFPVTPVLCFVASEEIDGWARGVMVCSGQHLAARLASQPPVLSADSLKRVTSILQWQLTSAQRPLPRSSSTMPRRAPATRRTWVAPKLISGLLAAVFGLVLLVVGVSASLGLLGRVARDLGHEAHAGVGVGSGGGARAQTASSPTLGEVVRVPASQSHPDLLLKADKVMRVRSTMPGYALQQGHHLVAVRYEIRNEGKQIWGAESPYLQFSVLTSDGAHASRGSYAAVPRKKLLPAAFNLRPGKARQGFVVFSVPNGTKVVRVSVQTSFGAGDGVEWLIS